MNKTLIAASLAGAIALTVPTAASAAEQIISFGGTLDYGSVWNTSPFGSNGAQLGGKTYKVTMSYDPALFAGKGSCGTAVNTSCQYTFTDARPMTATFTVGDVTKTYTWTSGTFDLSSGGPDQFGFNFQGAAGSFSGHFSGADNFYPNQASVNTAVFAPMNNQSVSAGTFQFNNSGAGFGDAPNKLSTSYTATTGAVPEPATWALMILGFGAIGFAMRRRAVQPRIRFA